MRTIHQEKNTRNSIPKREHEMELRYFQQVALFESLDHLVLFSFSFAETHLSFNYISIK